MSIIIEFLKNFWDLANAMSIYILFGLLIAGVLKEILPQDFISKHLGKNSWLSVIKSTVLGIPLPVCSCSVVPLAKSLQKEGASRGAVQSFLISSPITGVDSILATYSFFGWFFTFYRVVTSVFIAIFTGIVQNIFDNKEVKSNFSAIKPAFGMGIAPKANFGNKTATFTMPKEDEKSCCSSGSCCDSQVKVDKKFSIKRVFSYAFDILFGDIAKSLLIGLVVGALFSTFLPKELMSSLSQNLLLTYILVLVISMPLYVCATSSLPIGASLLMSGLPVGAVFVFLSAGPATNSVTMSIVKDMFGKKAFFIYLISIALFSLLFGYVLDTSMIDMDVAKSITHHDMYGFVNYLASVIMIGLIGYYIWRKR